MLKNRLILGVKLPSPRKAVKTEMPTIRSVSAHIIMVIGEKLRKANKYIII